MSFNLLLIILSLLHITQCRGCICHCNRRQRSQAVGTQSIASLSSPCTFKKLWYPHLDQRKDTASPGCLAAALPNPPSFDFNALIYSQPNPPLRVQIFAGSPYSTDKSSQGHESIYFITENTNGVSHSSTDQAFLLPSVPTTITYCHFKILTSW